MHNYIYWYWNNIFNKSEIKNINSFIDKNFDFYENEKDHAVDLNGKSKKITNVKKIYFKKIKHFLNNFKDIFMYDSNINFGYQLFGLNDLDQCNLNIYSSKNLGKYDWHTDLSMNPLYDIKLTLLINLSQKEYEGGQFYIFNTNEIEVKELNTPGSAIIFPSFLNHKVMPVTKGERRTLALFLIGPKFK
jgi:prenyltransferase beta subunit